MTTAPATRPLSTPEGEPQHQAGATPTTPEPITLNRWQTAVIATVATGAVGIAALGFIGSYHAVADLAEAKGFGGFAHWFPIAVDLGIAVFLALDLVLTRLRMTYPLLRYGAWLMTAATISFNAAVAWRPAGRPATAGPDYLGAAMHAVIPVLFVIAVEAARHAIGRIANITADKHIESPPLSRWLLAPTSTFHLYRWMRICGIRAYDTALRMQRDIDLYIAELKKDHGRWAWRRTAPADALLVLKFARKGIPMTEARDLPEQHRAAAEKAKHDAKLAREAAEEERRREREEAERQRRLAAEREQRDREETERQARLAAEAEKAERERLEQQRLTAIAVEEAKRRRIAAETEAAERAAEETARIRIQTEQRIAAAKADAAEAIAAAERRAAEAKTDAERQAAQADADAARVRADTAAQIEHARARDALSRLDADRKERERRVAEDARRRAEVRNALANQSGTKNTGTANQTNSGPRTTNPNREPAPEPRTTTRTGTANQPNLANSQTTNQANLEPAKPNPRTTNPANLTDRSRTKQNQIEQVLELIDNLGYAETTLGLVMERTGMSKTTAYHRLTDARAIWKQRKAS